MEERERCQGPAGDIPGLSVQGLRPCFYLGHPGIPEQSHPTDQGVGCQDQSEEFSFGVTRSVRLAPWSLSIPVRDGISAFVPLSCPPAHLGFRGALLLQFGRFSMTMDTARRRRDRCSQTHGELARSPAFLPSQAERMRGQADVISAEPSTQWSLCWEQCHRVVHPS